jgi:hypothetical protein
MMGEGDQRTAVEEQIQEPVVEQQSETTEELVQQPETPAYEQNAIASAKEEARRAKEIAEFYKELYSKQVTPQQQQQQVPQGNAIEIDDNELIDGATLRSILKARDEETAFLKEAIERANIEATADRMRATTPDFDNAFNLGMEVLNTYPEFQHAVRVTADKVRFVYNLAKHHPSYQQAPAKNVEKTLQNISANAQKPATLSGVPGSSNASGGFKQMEQKDFDKFLHEVLDK